MSKRGLLLRLRRAGAGIAVVTLYALVPTVSGCNGAAPPATPTPASITIRATDPNGKIDEHQIDYATGVEGTIAAARELMKDPSFDPASVLRAATTRVDGRELTRVERTLSDGALGGAMTFGWSEDAASFTLDVPQYGQARYEVAGIEDATVRAQFIGATALLTLHALANANVTPGAVAGGDLKAQPQVAWVIVVVLVAIVGCFAAGPLCTGACWGACGGHLWYANGVCELGWSGWLPTINARCTCHCRR